MVQRQEEEEKTKHVYQTDGSKKSRQIPPMDETTIRITGTRHGRHYWNDFDGFFAKNRCCRSPLALDPPRDGESVLMLEME